MMERAEYLSESNLEHSKNLHELVEIIKELQSKDPWYIQKTKEFNELIEGEVDRVIKETLESDLDNSKS